MHRKVYSVTIGASSVSIVWGPRRASLEMTRLVLVPMRVRVPPKTAAYARGMRSFFGLTPALLPQAIMMGMSSATMGVLFSTLQSRPVRLRGEKSTTCSEAGTQFKIMTHERHQSLVQEMS